MAVGSIQPLTEMSTGDLLLGGGGVKAWLTIMPPSCAVCLKILGASVCLGPYWHGFVLYILPVYVVLLRFYRPQHKAHWTVSSSSCSYAARS
jgi:hypothetical protein